MKAAELPPALRRALASGKARAEPEAVRGAMPPRATSRARGQLKPPWRWRCHQCGATWSKWAPAERHADTAHDRPGGRIDCHNPHDLRALGDTEEEK